MRSTALLAFALVAMLTSAAFAADPPRRSGSNANKPKGKAVYVMIQKGSSTQMVRIDFGEIERPETPSAIPPSEPAPPSTPAKPAAKK